MSEDKETKKQFSIQKMYIKDASFESPGAPESFQFNNWDPRIELNLANDQKRIGDDLYEVVLSVTATVTHEESTAFLVEVHQGGLFALTGFTEEEKKYLLATQCMSTLFPYAREVVSDLTVRGGFPPLLLTPVNFDALYQQHLRRQQSGQDETEAAPQAQ
jgi:preprotein translocase subunit SecB